MGAGLVQLSATDASTRGSVLGTAGKIGLAAVPILVMVIVTVPVVFLVVSAFSSGNLGSAGTTFTVDKVVDAYTDPALLRAVRNSIVLGVTVSLISTAVTLPIAWALSRTNVPGRYALIRLMTFAFYVSPLLLAMAWSGIAAPRSGFLSQIYRTIIDADNTDGVGNIYSFPGIVFVSVLHFVPICYLLLSSAFTSVSGRLEEASQMCRASQLQTFRRVTAPLITPTIIACLLQVAVFSAEEFSIPFLLGLRTGFETLPTEIVRSLSNPHADYNRAAAAGTMLLWFTILGIVLFRHFSKKGDRYATLDGKGAAGNTTDLKAWRWPACLAVSAYLFLAVGAPILALAWGSFNAYRTPSLTLDNLSTRHWVDTLSDSSTLHAMSNSVLVAFVGTIITVVVCAILSFIIIRTKFLGRAAIDYATSIPLAFPAVVLALGILWLYISLPFPLYGTLVGLGLAYAIRYLGYGVRSVNAGMLQVHSELSEAAYMCRAPMGRVIRTIIIPLLRPSLANTSVVIFVRFIQELNMTILLYTQATITVPVVMFVQLGTSLANAVYPLALLLMLVTFVCVQFLYWMPADAGSVARRRSRVKSTGLIAKRVVMSGVGAHG